MKKLIYFIDDGNRLEKAELIDHLKNKFDLSIVTHDQATYQRYNEDIKTFLIKPNKNRRRLRGLLKVLLIKPLKTNNRFYRDMMQLKKASLLNRGMLFIKKQYQKLIFIDCSVAKIYKWVYPTKNKQYDFLNDFSFFLYSPVSIKCFYIVHEARLRNLKIINWIYSWDNPMKDNETIRGADYYFVWNKESKADLKKYHMICESKIHIVGPVQFDYLIQSNDKRLATKTKTYVLYVCAYAIKEHVEQEVINIIGIKNLLKAMGSTVELVVRPYPFIEDMDWYNQLVNDGIQLDPLPNNWNPYKLTQKDIVNKKDQLNDALCIINFSSTIVLEASFTSSPIIQMIFSFENNFPDSLHINQTLKNPHLKHLILEGYPNICKSINAMRLALFEILQGDRVKYMKYSKKLQEFSHPINDAHSYKDVFCETLNQL